MNVVFRVDASVQIGTGHVMRCVTLARQLRDQLKNVTITFICRELRGHYIEKIKREKFNVFRLKAITKQTSEWDWYKTNWYQDCMESILFLKNQSIDLLVIDHYGLDEKWETTMKEYVQCLMVIDDLANRKHHCKILLDQNFQRNNDRYRGLVPKHCKLLLGTDYCLLREEFISISDQIKPRTGTINDILIFFGGSDPQSLTLQTVDILQSADLTGIHVHVVVGESNQEKEKIAATCRKKQGYSFYCQIDFMAELMNQADLAIGAGGTASWERLYVGLPSLTMITADNQVELTNIIEKQMATICIGWNQQMLTDQLVNHLVYLQKNPAIVRNMSKKALQMINKEKVKTYPVVSAIMEEFL